MSKSFELFNQTLVIDDELYLDIQLHNAVKVCAKNAQNDFLNRYNKLGDLDTVIKKGIDNAHDTLEKAASMCVEFLTSLEIYNVSPAEILRQMKGSYFLEEFEQLEDWYVSLLNDEAQKDAYRTARRKNRSKWRSAGFGLNNAMAGAAQAGVLNLASGTVHGAVNLVGKSFSVIGASMSKGSMYKEASKRLANAIYMDVYDWIYLLESFIAHNGYSIDSISIEDERDAVNLFSNLKNMHVSGNQAYRIAFELFETNPCEFEYYEYCVQRFPEQQKNLIQLADYCNINASLLSEPILEKIFNTMPHQTEEETILLHEKLKDKQTELGITHSSTLDKTEKLLHDFDVAARTFHGILYETRDLRASAEKDYDILTECCANVNTSDISECEQIKEKILDGNYDPQILQLFLNQISLRISSIKHEDAKKYYNELYNKYAADILILKFVRKWWKIPLIMSGCVFILLMLCIFNVLALDMDFFFYGQIVLWIIFAVVKDILFTKYAPEELKDAKEKLKKAENEYEATKKTQDNQK